MIQFFQNPQTTPINRAFLYGDGVWVAFYIRKSQLILAEESYFFLMASMRKLRMNIPLSYTLEYFQDLFQKEVIDQGVSQGRIRFFAYRSDKEESLEKREINFYFEVEEGIDPIATGKEFEIDILKEISLHANLLSHIYTHSSENIYAQIYAKENDLDDVILLNSDKRVARTSLGNLLLLNDNKISIPKSSEGAYISPLLESFVTFLDKKAKALIDETEFIGFQTQKADEILMFSEFHGIHPVTKIRNKEFPTTHFEELLQLWRESFD